MKILLAANLPEILLLRKEDSLLASGIRRLAKGGKAVRLATGVYTTNTESPAAEIVRRNIFSIAGHLYPGALLSHRSALECRPTKSGNLFLTHSYTRSVKLPGVTLRLLKGPSVAKGDFPWMGGLFASGKARALLENLQQSRQEEDESKTLSRKTIEEVLETTIRTAGEEGINALRDEARQIAEGLGMESEFQKLNQLVSALLSSRPAKLLTSPAAQARALGEPYDTDRLNLFQGLFQVLQRTPFPSFPDPNKAGKAFEHAAFFEAYFSNYIEGTEFEVAEALQIVESGVPLPHRQEDSHDILGTYALLRSKHELQKAPQTTAAFLNLLRARHGVLMAARTDKQPGVFKDKANRAGDTHFVAPALVNGTLKKGFELYTLLEQPFSKAAFMMFLVSEVHPFLDGNGRIARLMMNAALVQMGETRIIIPTVYREDYLGALRRLTRQQDAGPYIRMLSRAQAFSASLNGSSIAGMEAQLRMADAFREPQLGQLKF